MTPELRKRLEDAVTLSELEDIYLPYRPRRRTRATIAREKGLEPLAEIIFRQETDNTTGIAENYVGGEVASADEAIAGASDIIAEWISENEEARKEMRKLYEKEAVIRSVVIKGKEAEGKKYFDYFDWSELLCKCPSHRYLAMRRGENEGFLRLSIAPDDSKALRILEKLFIRKNNRSADILRATINDSWKRLLGPSMESEFRNIAKERADDEAIKVFADNLRQLLLAPPLGEKNVLAIDPGYRTGCKIVCLDRQGNLLHNETIYPHTPQS